MGTAAGELETAVRLRSTRDHRLVAPHHGEKHQRCPERVGRGTVMITSLDPAPWLTVSRQWSVCAVTPARIGPARRTVVGDGVGEGLPSHPKVLLPAGTTRSPAVMTEARFVPCSSWPGGIGKTIWSSPFLPSSARNPWAALPISFRPAPGPPQWRRRRTRRGSARAAHRWRAA